MPELTIFDGLRIEFLHWRRGVVAGLGVGSAWRGACASANWNGTGSIWNIDVAGRDGLAFLTATLMILPEISGVISTFCAPT